MARVEKIDEKTDVIIIDEMRTCWLVRDRKKILIESGHPADAAELISALEQLQVGPGDLDYVALTHIHVDHAGGAGYLVKENPRLKVFVHEKGARHLADPGRLNESVRSAYGERFTEVGQMVPVPSGDVIVPVGTGDAIDLGGTRLEVYSAPGHAKHHVVYFDRSCATVFSGDALGSKYPGLPNFVLAPPVDYDLRQAKESVDMIARLRPEKAHFTHCGPWSLDGDQEFYENLKSKHDLWVKTMLEVVREEPGVTRARLLGAFLKKMPELKEYPSQFFSFNLSVNGIYIYLKRTGQV
ncbi:MBL fold metallo-hydrolase [Thermodesulfobacteriota bacterium]